MTRWWARNVLPPRRSAELTATGRERSPMLSPTYLSNAWERVRTSYWFVPTLLSTVAAVASVLMQRLDYAVGASLPANAWWLYGGDASGARTVLGAVSGSMITVASVVFSITIVTLTLASAQFGSRLLRTFIRDRGNQIVLGVFIATFLYSLLVLRSVRGSEGTEFVPYLSVTLAVALAIASVGVLIYFIHHVSVSIQADQVVAAVAGEVNESIQRLFPEQLGGSPGDVAPHRQAPTLPDAADARVVRAGRDGYVQAIDADRLLELAHDHDLVLELVVRPGAFLAESSPILCGWPRDRVGDTLAADLSRTFVLGPHRSLTQDAEYGFHQLVEIAVRALSPGINDPFTAMSCLDRLGAVLCRLTGKRFPSAYRYDDEGTLRVVAETPTFAEFLDSALNQIRHNAASSPAVLIRLLEVVTRVAESARTDDQRAALRVHARLTREIGMREFSEERDRTTLDQHYHQSLALIGADPPSRGPMTRSA